MTLLRERRGAVEWLTLDRPATGNAFVPPLFRVPTVARVQGGCIGGGMGLVAACDFADAWYVPGSVKIGYEFSFTRYFYKPQPMRSLEEIRADILALEKETEGLLSDIVGTRRTKP